MFVFEVVCLPVCMLARLAMRAFVCACLRACVLVIVSGLVISCV